mmetsp:Transcript_63055/g.167891  ORF Transcript_63055/g.167891 Transcript_63055/m.167891 type:complete len:204 (-) Transcript_63055:699-1310(-)
MRCGFDPKSDPHVPRIHRLVIFLHPFLDHLVVLEAILLVGHLLERTVFDLGAASPAALGLARCPVAFGVDNLRQPKTGRCLLRTQARRAAERREHDAEGQGQADYACGGHSDWCIGHSLDPGRSTGRQRSQGAVGQVGGRRRRRHSHASVAEKILDALLACWSRLGRLVAVRPRCAGQDSARGLRAGWRRRRRPWRWARARGR